MPRFAANLSMLYPELDFLDRFEAAARDGFEAVECMSPYAWDAREISVRLKANGLELVLFNTAPGNSDGSARGLACIPGLEAEFAKAIEQALAYAQTLDCPRIHAVAGLVPARSTRESVRATYVANLRKAAAIAAKQGVDLLLEPVNTRDIPGFFLNRQEDAHGLVEEIGASNVKVQFDLYHCQVVEGDVAMKLRQYLPGGRVGHFQIAGVPQRHEPDLGELHYPYLLV